MDKSSAMLAGFLGLTIILSSFSLVSGEITVSQKTGYIILNNIDYDLLTPQERFEVYVDTEGRVFYNPFLKQWDIYPHFRSEVNG